jgi:16S rRNA (adenine1518-N6/adenine1519-N6)-dimethyltransferase
VNSLRQLLALHDIRPRKRLGQSFLEDMNVTRRIASLAEPSEGDTIVEIGAGLGFLTEELARKAGKVIALEIDPRLLDVLRRRFTGNPGVEIVDADVLRYDFSAVSRGRRIKVVGNVPYRISTPILFRLLDFRRWIQCMILMFQKELAERIAAPPGTKDYGIPSVLAARYASVFRELTVPPACFYPRPSVDSSVLRVVMKDDPGMLPGEDLLFTRVVRAAFATRRKTLRNNLRAAGFPEETLDRVFQETGIDAGRRAETLSVEEFARLSVGLAGAVCRRPPGTEKTGESEKNLDMAGEI